MTRISTKTHGWENHGSSVTFLHQLSPSTTGGKATRHNAQERHKWNGSGCKQHQRKGLQICVQCGLGPCRFTPETHQSVATTQRKSNLTQTEAQNAAVRKGAILPRCIYAEGAWCLFLPVASCRSVFNTVLPPGTSAASGGVGIVSVFCATTGTASSC